MNRKYLLILLLFIFKFSFAQKDLKTANFHYENYEYATAIPFYKNALYIDTTLEAVEKLADCYRLTNQYKEALYWYEKALEIPYYSATSVLYYADMLKTAGRYNEAISQYELYELYLQENQKEKIKKQIKACEYAKTIISKNNAIAVENVKEINTKFSESGIAIYNSQLVFSSDRKMGSNNLIDPYTKNHYFKLFAVAFTKNKEKTTYQKAKLFENYAINKSYHNAFPTFDLLNNQIYFTRTQLNPKKEINRIEIYKSRTVNGKRWQEPQLISINNSNQYSVLHPSVSPDSKYLVFASDQPGGYGGYDLYISEIMDDGSLSTAQNLGNKINTEENELFPTFNSFGDLYFSSKGHLGLGGLDIYLSQYKNGLFEAPVHLESPINSSYDDYSIIFTEPMKTGYFCSDRVGGKGSDDIYYFEYLRKK